MSMGTTSVQIGRRPSPVTLTDAAAAKVAELLAEEEGGESLALRVAVRPGGCSGYSYDMFFDSEIAEDDIVRSFGDGQGRRRPGERRPHQRRDARLPRRAPGLRVPHHEPERHPDLRLRLLLQLSAGA